MLFIFTGKGKGKTTGAIGQAVRVLGNGKRAALIQFIKSPKWPAGEEAALKKFGRKCKIYKGGKGFVGIMGDRLPRSAHKVAAEKTWDIAKKIVLSRKFDLVVLDELNVALALNLLKAQKALAFLKNIPKGLDIIITGRDAPKELLKIADLVTECKEVKHPFQKGVWGKRGREY